MANKKTSTVDKLKNESASVNQKIDGEVTVILFLLLDLTTNKNSKNLGSSQAWWPIIFNPSTWEADAGGSLN